MVISVIVPVYNGEKYIQRCIHSIIIQPIQDIEITIIDDGSTDRTHDICSELAASDSRIKYYFQENQGVSRARRNGARMSSGQFITFVDADDYLLPNAINILMTAAKPNSSIVVSGATDETISFEEYLLRLISGKIRPYLCAKLYSRSLFLDYAPDLNGEIKMGEDLLINLILGLHSGSIVCIKDNIYNYDLSNPTSTCKIFIRTQEYEQKYYSIFDSLFLSNCKRLSNYENILLHTRISQVNGLIHMIMSKQSTISKDYVADLSQYFSSRKNYLPCEGRIALFIKKPGIRYHLIMIVNKIKWSIHR